MYCLQDTKKKWRVLKSFKAGYRYGDDAPMAVIELVDRDVEAKKVDKPKKVETAEKDQQAKVATK